MSARPVALMTGLLLVATACAPPRVLEGARLEQLAELSAQVEQARLMTDVAELVSAHQQDVPVDCSELRADRYPAFCHLTRDKAGALMQARFEALGLRVERHLAGEGRYPTSNLIAELPGTSRPEEVVLVGAHFDAYYGGADDNSSGVAAVLELARVLSQHRFERTIRFVGFDLEELGLVGSSRYVRYHPGTEQLVFSMVLDCVGYYDSTPGSQRSLPGLPPAASGDFLTAIANEPTSSRAAELYALNEALGLTPLLTILAPNDGGAFTTAPLLRSDHAPFWLTGREALFLTDTAEFRNLNYHQQTDTPETLEPAGFRRSVQLMAAALAYWAGGPL